MSGIEALLAGRHSDPHQVLGVHRVGEKTLVRALRPGAASVTLHAGGHMAPFARRDGDLFEVRVDDPIVDYELETAYPDGTQVTEVDAYRFPPTLGELDLHLFGEGRHDHLTQVLGARPFRFGEIAGTAFSVWAPAAHGASVVGDFNMWNPLAHPMRALGSSGIWELFIPDVGPGAVYKFSILGADGRRMLKSDPVARATEIPPRTASIVWDSKFVWSDEEWRTRRREASPWRAPISIYEVHLGSWRQGRRYVELADELGAYARDMGFTHVEFLPVMEHPFGGSWGYQVTGFFAPTARFGSPDEFRALVDGLHRQGIGVILDWVPAHFPKDEWALSHFDGTALYEHQDARRGVHPDWDTFIFNHGRNEVRNFLISSARTWIEDFHVDGLRVDAVASMLYLDYSRQADGWVPNLFGGREDLEALAFLRELNTVIYRDHPDVLMIAEESTAWPGVSRPVSEGGLGFGFKWNMGWMHDTLTYFSHDPIYRRYHHNDLTFAMVYAFSENFILPLSHDEVVHGKGSLIAKMPGDRWQQFANLRALYGFMWAHPGKKLLFMGDEFAQDREWGEDRSLDWDLLDAPQHAQVQTTVCDLNRRYRSEPALWELDSHPGGFRWIVADDANDNVVAFERRSSDGVRRLVCVANLSPVPRERFALSLPLPGYWSEVINTDSALYGGSNMGNGGMVIATEATGDGYRAEVTLPPLATLWLVPQED